LYVYFAIHTYRVKVYFKISQNASSIIYPNLYMNNVKQSIVKVQENINGVDTTKYVAQAEGFGFNTSIQLRVDKFMLGTGLKKWQDANGSQLTTQSTYNINSITDNIELTVVLQYLSYNVHFIIVDEDGNECNYGRVTSSLTSVQLLDTVNYLVDTNKGYVLKQKYAYNALEEKIKENIDSGFIFNPANFKIEEGHKFKIYLEFALKSIDLSVINAVDGDLYYFSEQEVSSLATYTITRKRGDTVTVLNDETGYQIQTNDFVTLEINPISIGIDLNHVKLGSTIITTESLIPYSLVPINVYEDDVVIGVYYQLQIDFAPSVIDKLNAKTELINVLKVRTYNVSYTYNFINSKFGITLIRQYQNLTVYGDPDEALNISNVGFGSSVKFSYVYEGMNNELTNKFRINGFTVAGIKQETTEGYSLEDIELWEQISINKYLEGSNSISVVLVLVPKITLTNYTTYSEENGYLYERTYRGENQGLIVGGQDADVVISGNFEVIVKYDIGAGFLDAKPINIGEYPVKIIAKITSANSQTIDVEFEQTVVYKILPAQLTLGLKNYNSTNPVTKIYDGTENLSSIILINDFAIEGLFDIDKNGVFVDSSRLSAKFSGTLVNDDATLYDINVFDIFLLDASNNTIENYVLSSGQNLVFTRIGKILQKPLHITGFKVSNKVYDGTNTVNVNIEEIMFDGKLETDSTEILRENLDFYLEDFTVGYARKVSLDWSNALVGADSTNYSITYDEKFIDIHPYELQYSIEGYGTFKIVDVDKLCLIPIDAELFASVYAKGSPKYRELYSQVEREISQDEKLKIGYGIVLRVGVVNQLLPEGVYVYLPKAKKTTQVIQKVDDNKFENLDFTSQKNFTVVKVKTGQAEFAMVVSTTYLPLWLIILIIFLALAIIGLITFVFIAVRRRSKNKYSSYDKI